jgi:hypothetical protein
MNPDEWERWSAEHLTRRPIVDPLSSWCPQCGANRYIKCRTLSGKPIPPRQSHAERSRLASPVQYVEGSVE